MTDKKEEIYVSTDVEADGPIPGPYSMLSFGSVAFGPDGKRIGGFTANLTTLQGATQHPDTMKWWATEPAAWSACRVGAVAPEVVIPDYRNWVLGLPGIPVFVGFPATFDFMFISWYLHRFAGDNPFGHHALDIKSYAMAVLKSDFKRSTKKFWPKKWFGSEKHTHVALEDAEEQGGTFLRILRENRK